MPRKPGGKYKGKKSTRKFIMAWIVGGRCVKKERALLEREHGWRHCCDCPVLFDRTSFSGFHVSSMRKETNLCCAEHGIGSTTRMMPFDVIADERKKECSFTRLPTLPMARSEPQLALVQQQ